ncbi:TetR family transcriptional regulator [Mycobacterium sp.]|uniref:TetR family transcriptional regulator n=1 Tax=Mycobacterium sp. TaxID=1785 RepID=UPI003A8735E2
MARQVRAEVTRRKILDSAIVVFGEVGYAAAGWGAIVDRTGMTKGALYHHFDSKEALASEIIDEGTEVLVSAFHDACGPGMPGLENIIHGTFVMARVLASDRTACAADQLAAALSGYNDAAARRCAGWAANLSAQLERAVAEGDLRADIDVEAFSVSIVGALIGARVVTTAVSKDRNGGNPTVDFSWRLGQMWALLLPGAVAEKSLPYFQQFLARETLRHTPLESADNSADGGGEDAVGAGTGQGREGV